MTSTISPDSGAITSETALTDSTSAYDSSFVTVVPTSGGSKKTTSPRASWANQVMPNVGDVAVDAGPVVLRVVEEVVGVACVSHRRSLR